MKISVVTISFNQGEFLERTIRSVIDQRGVDFEYIIVDPGSTDGSRDIIEKYREHFAAVILEPDAGPSDGLNKGFARATGEVFYYLNSDDTLEPGAFATAACAFERDAQLDVLCGHAWFVDGNDRRLRRVWSDPWLRPAQAYGTAIQIQPSTFFRSGIFRKVGGFNVEDRWSWDGEFFDRLCLAGAKYKVIDAFLSNFRLHSAGMSGGGPQPERVARLAKERFRRIMGRDWAPNDPYWRYFWRFYRQLRHPRAFTETLLHGSIHAQAQKAT